MQQLDGTAKQQIKVLQMLCGALSATTLIYLFLANQAVERNQVIEGTLPSFEHPMLFIFGGASVLAVVMGIVLPNILLKSSRQRNQGKAIPFAEIFPPNIIRFAMFESIAIFGLLVGMASRDMNYSYLATGLTLGLFMAFFPTNGRVASQISGV